MIDLGGPMPDGTRARSMLVAAADFVCASPAYFDAKPAALLGKLCLTRSSLLLLPYEGALVRLATEAATRLRHLILGPYADLAERLAKLGLYARGPEVLDDVLVWPLDTITAARVELRDFLIFHAGAELFITTAHGEFGFSMQRSGAEVRGFASAETFLGNFRRLRQFAPA